MFKPDQFTPTQWDTQKDKAKFANHFVKFVKSDFDEKLFPRWFYVRLSMTFGHIAHYDRGGFYNHFFTETRRKVLFIRQCVEWPCWGHPEWTYSDVERALRLWLKEEKCLEKYENILKEETEKRERQLYQELHQKFGSAQG